MNINTHSQSPKNKSSRQQNKYNAGFSLAEIIVAGTILIIIMTGVARISIKSITNSRNRTERDNIEAAIHDNIQLIYQADSKILYETIPKKDQEKACQNPANYLKIKLDTPGKTYVPKPKVYGFEGKNLIKRSIQAGDNPGITVVTYEFIAPEYAIGKEKRTIELNPNFQTHCILK